MNTTKIEKSYENLYSNEFQRMITENADAVVIDVRTQEEFHSGRIQKSINIDVMDNSFAEKISKLDKDKTYFVYCRGGGRSRQACGIMLSNGLKVYNLVGGIANWKGKVI